MKKLCLFLICIMLFQSIPVYAETLQTDKAQEVVVRGNDALSDLDENYFMSNDQESGGFNPSEEEMEQIKIREEVAEELYQDYISKNKVNSATSGLSKQSSLYSNTSCILDMIQYPQEKDYYCGNATAKSILMYEGIDCSQEMLAGSNYLKTDALGNTPWYMTHGGDPTQFPMAVTLRKLSGVYYMPYPYGAAGANPITVSALKQRVVSSILSNHGVAICGRSDADTSATSHIPGYPTNRPIGHWVASDGFISGGESIHIVDPVANSVVNWGANISPTYFISATKTAAFAASRGIIWATQI